MFKEKMGILNSILLKKQYKELISAGNIESLSYGKIKKILKSEEHDVRNIYLHNVIADWWEKQDETYESFKKLKKLFKKTKINITDLDKYNLFLIEERIFSTQRHIKTIDVKMELLPKESVGVKYTKASLYERNKKLENINNGEVLFTNVRIIFIDKSQTVSFNWEELSKVKYKYYGFEFRFNSKIYVIRIHDQKTLNNTLENFISKRVKIWKNT